MAGHSKWANIKRQKARVDAKKGKTFTQLSRAIIVAARNGIPDPAGNFQLRTAIEKAKAAGIPNDNIARSLAKGAGTYQEDGVVFEEIRYEGYGVDGVAILIEALTDNRNRAAADIRAAFTKNGGNLGETGCVSWMFDQKGVVILEGEFVEDILLEASAEGGADNYEIIETENIQHLDWVSRGNLGTPLGQTAEVFTDIANLETLHETLKASGLPVKEAELRWIPNNKIEVHDAEKVRSLTKLIDTLESLDDVQNVTANCNLADELVTIT